MKKIFLKVKNQKFVQRFVFALLIITTALTLFYALSFMTGLNILEAFAKSNSEDMLYVQGVTDFYAKVQNFNRMLLVLSLVLILLALSTFVFFSQKRRIYYMSNYIASISYAIFSVFLACFITFSIVSIMGVYNSLDLVTLNQKIELNFPNTWGLSTNVFYLGMVLSAVLIILAVLLIVNVFNKIKQKRTILMRYASFDTDTTDALQQN
ncbi:MAG: hypothetical protein LBU60_03680 [Clostridiales bacterium]|jgi:hypothetical protein|nr:hypothetical protein [Clostridiales bacterium]